MNNGGSFTNHGTITIGASASVGQVGLGNYQGTFINQAQGLIQINNSTGIGLDNNSGTVINEGQLIIGNTASMGGAGLVNQDRFINQAQGRIQIDRSTTNGLYTLFGSFVNSASITIGATASVGATAVLNGASFTNSGCSALLNVVADAVISNFASFSNTGTIIENASGNSSISFNGGVVVNNNGGTFTIGGGTGPLSITGSNPTTCIPPNGSLTISGLQASTSYTLSYTVGGSNTTLTPTSTGSGAVTVSSLAAGVYSLLLSGSCLAQSLPLSATLNAPAALTASLVSSGSLNCASPTVTLTATGGTSYTFANAGGTLGTPGSASTLVVSAGGSYSVTVGNANGCTSSTTTTVLSDTALPTVSVLPISGTLTCANPSLTLTATSSGTGVRWSDNSTATTLIVNTPGTYSVTATGANGCTAVSNAVIIGQDIAAPGSPTLSASNSGTLTCAITSLTLTASATGTSLTYAFAGPSGTVLGSGNTRTVSAPGTYSVTITGANGCTASQSTSVASNTAAPTVTITPGPSLTISSIQTATLTASGTANSFTWSTGVNTPAISVSVSGTYSVTGTLATNGCSATASVVLSVTSAAPIITTQPATASSVCEGASVMVSVVVSNSVTGYQWLKGGSPVAGQTGPTLSLGNVQVSDGGVYSLSVTGPGGSTTSNGFTRADGNLAGAQQRDGAGAGVGYCHHHRAGQRFAHHLPGSGRGVV